MTSLLPTRIRNLVTYVNSPTEVVRNVLEDPVDAKVKVPEVTADVAAEVPEVAADVAAEVPETTAVETAAVETEVDATVTAATPDTTLVIVDTLGNEALEAQEMAQKHTTRQLKDIALKLGVSQIGKKIDICTRIILARASSQGVSEE